LPSTIGRRVALDHRAGELDSFEAVNVVRGKLLMDIALTVTAGLS